MQAADTVAESEYILDIANKTEFVSGVVGWVNFENKNVKNDIDKLSENPYLKGFRPMIHDIEDINWMLKNEFGMNPLCVCATPSLATELGRLNLDNFVESGFNLVEI